MSLTGNPCAQLAKSFLIYCAMVRGNEKMKRVDFFKPVHLKNKCNVANVKAFDFTFMHCVYVIGLNTRN